MSLTPGMEKRLEALMEMNNNQQKELSRIPPVSGLVDLGEPIFPPGILATIAAEVALIVPFPPGSAYRVRPLYSNDNYRGFLQLLSQLTDVGHVSNVKFQERFAAMKNTGDYLVVAIEDTLQSKVVGAATLVLEMKFIHEAGRRARIEDVVVAKECRGLKFGKILGEILTRLAKEMGVYKCSLECKDHLIPFYESFGYKVDVGNNFLVQRFPKSNL